MNARSLTTKLVLLAFALALPAVCSAQKLFSWKDENGVTHFGDRIPPEYADKDRAVLNDQGIVVNRQQGGLTDEQRAERERLAAETEAKQKQEQQDRVLLQSYTAVAEIEATRDRRLAQVDAQIANIEQSLADSRARLAQFQQNAGRFKPYSQDENAREMPAQLAANIKQSETAIADYEARLAGYRSDREEFVESFANDIRRFKELKGL